MRNRTSLMAGCAAALAALGCASEPPAYRVEGTVTYNDQPVQDGEIHFRSADGRWGAEAGRIKGGRYVLMAKVGAKRVEITASRPLPGGARGAGGEPVPEEYIPEEYNAKSKLTAEVSADGKNEFDFRLTGPKR